MIDRKEAIRKFKERKIARGIFVVRSKATGRCWVDSSLNLDSARNSVWFELRHGNHRNRELQEEWNAQGEADFEFEVVETLDDDIAEMSVRDELKQKRRDWGERLGAPTISP
jgi:hypothetical protein